MDNALRAMDNALRAMDNASAHPDRNRFQYLIYGRRSFPTAPLNTISEVGREIHRNTQAKTPIKNTSPAAKSEVGRETPYQKHLASGDEAFLSPLSGDEAFL